MNTKGSSSSSGGSDPDKRLIEVDCTWSECSSTGSSVSKGVSHTNNGVTDGRSITHGTANATLVDDLTIHKQALLEAKAEKVAELFQCGQLDLEGMARIQRKIKDMVRMAGDDVSIEELVDRANKQFGNPSQKSNSCEDK